MLPFSASQRACSAIARPGVSSRRGPSSTRSRGSQFSPPAPSARCRCSRRSAPRDAGSSHEDLHRLALPLVLLVPGCAAPTSSGRWAPSIAGIRPRPPRAARRRVRDPRAGLRLVGRPVWVGGEDGYLLFSDIPPNRVWKWSLAAGPPSISTGAGTRSIPRPGYVAPDEPGSNGLLLDAEGGSSCVSTASAVGRMTAPLGAPAPVRARRARWTASASTARTTRSSTRTATLLHGPAVRTDREDEGSGEGDRLPGGVQSDPGRRGDPAHERDVASQRDRFLARRAHPVRGELGSRPRRVDGLPRPPGRHPRRGPGALRRDAPGRPARLPDGLAVDVEGTSSRRALAASSSSRPTASSSARSSRVGRPATARSEATGTPRHRGRVPAARQARRRVFSEQGGAEAGSGKTRQA